MLAPTVTIMLSASTDINCSSVRDFEEVCEEFYGARVP